MEHVEKTPLERTDTGHLMHYMEYLKQNLVEGAETWISRIVCTPLDMFMNFLYQSGLCPIDPIQVLQT